MGFLLNIPSSMDVHLTEIALGEVKSPPGEGWAISAVVEVLEGTSGSAFVWTRSKIYAESSPSEKKGKKKT